jgi:predicted DNA-binding ribbon-helix-helix protein
LRPSRLVNRNVVAERGRTSIRFEPELWDSLQEICRRERIGLGELVRRIEQEAGPCGGRTSAVRVFVLTYFRSAATEEGHREAGHGRAFAPRTDWEDAAPPTRARAALAASPS